MRREHGAGVRPLLDFTDEVGLFRGTAGATDRKVYGALCRIAATVEWRDGTCDTFTASVRELAEKVGVRKNTVSASLARLVEAGLVALVTPSADRRASEWRLTDLSVLQNRYKRPLNTPKVFKEQGSMYRLRNDPPPRNGLRDVDALPPGGSPGVSLATNPPGGHVPLSQHLALDEDHHVIWERGALGPSAHRIWYVLNLQEGARNADICQATRLHASTVSRALRRLADVGLASQQGDQWFPEYRSLDEVAAEIGVSGKAEARRAAHEREREGYTHYRAVRLLERQEYKAASP